jgi:hypothetical protein
MYDDAHRALVRMSADAASQLGQGYYACPTSGRMSAQAPSSDHASCGVAREFEFPRSHFARMHEEALGFALPNAFIRRPANEADITKNASHVLTDVATLYGLPLELRSEHTFRVSVRL